MCKHIFSLGKWMDADHWGIYKELRKVRTRDEKDSGMAKETTNMEQFSEGYVRRQSTSKN